MTSAAGSAPVEAEVPQRWAAGAGVVLRQLFRGRVWNVTPAVVVADEPDLLVLWLPPHVAGKRAEGDILGEWSLVDVTWSGRPHGILRVRRPNEAHATLFLWERGWRVDGWYVNLERQPLRRTAFGVDYEDQLLDVWIGVDGEVRWLDQDEFEAAQQLGLIDRAEAEAVVDEGRRAIKDAAARRPPFDGTWERWRPDAEWPLPALPRGWDAGAAP